VGEASSKLLYALGCFDAFSRSCLELLLLDVLLVGTGLELLEIED
jgi:hypothetical protein